MADKKISQLTTNPGIDGTEEMPTARGGSNFKNTLDALKTWLASAIGSLQAVTGIGNETTHNIGVKIGDNTGDAKTTVTPTGVAMQYKDDPTPIAELSSAGVKVGDGTMVKIALLQDGGLQQIEDTKVETRHAKIHLTATQIQNLNGSTETLVAAPGAGKIIKLISAFAKLTFITTAFNKAPLYFYADGFLDPTLNYQLFIEEDFLNNASSIIESASLNFAIQETANLLENTAILLTTNTSTDAGGSDGTVDIYITYEIITL